MFNQLLYQYKNAGILAKVIAINAVIFLLLNACWVILSMAEVANITEGPSTFIGTYWLSAPASPLQLLTKPWTVITYMFTHQDIWHMVFNMLMLYFSGRIFCDLLNDRRFLPLYITGGLAGLLVFVVGYNFFPRLYPISELAFIHGASASVMAIFVGTATYFPKYEVYLFGVFRVKLAWLAVFYVAIDFVSLRGFSNVGGHLAHLGGAAYGFIYAIQLQKGTDLSEFYYRFVDFVTGLFQPKSKIKVVHRDNYYGKSSSSGSTASKSERQMAVDEILDKINKSGYESLSKAEKEILLKASKD